MSESVEYVQKDSIAICSKYGTMGGILMPKRPPFWKDPIRTSLKVCRRRYQLNRKDLMFILKVIPNLLLLFENNGFAGENVN